MNQEIQPQQTEGLPENMLSAAEALDRSLVRQLQLKLSTASERRRAIAIGSLPFLIYEASATTYFTLTDPSRVDLSIKILRSAINAATLPINLPAVTSSNPIELGAYALVGGTLLTALGWGVSKITGSISSVKAERKHFIRGQMEAGDLEISPQTTNHAVVVTWENNPLLKALRGYWDAPVLIANQTNPYDKLRPHQWPPLPVHVAGLSTENEVLQRAGILKAARLDVFPMKTRDMIFIARQDEHEVKKRIAFALDTIVTAYHERGNDPGQKPLDVVLVAHEDIRIPGPKVRTNHGIASSSTSIIEYLLEAGLPQEYIDNHVHIIDSRKVLLKGLTPFKDKPIAITGDDAFMTLMEDYLQNNGYFVGPIENAQVVVHYEENDQLVVTSPMILRAALKGRGKIQSQQGETLTIPSADIQLVGIYEKEADIVGEVLAATPLDFEAMMRAEYEAIADRIEQYDILWAKEHNEPVMEREIHVHPMRNKRSTIVRDHEKALVDDEFAMRTEEMLAWGEYLYNNLSRITETLIEAAERQLQFSDMSTPRHLNLFGALHIIRYKKIDGPGILRQHIGPLEYTVTRRFRKGNLTRISIDLSWRHNNHFDFDRNSRPMEEDIVYRCRFTIKNGVLQLSDARILIDGKAHTKLRDQKDSMGRLITLLEQWGKAKGIPEEKMPSRVLAKRFSPPSSRGTILRYP